MCFACNCDTFLPSTPAGALTQKGLSWSLHVHQIPELDLQCWPLCGCPRPPEPWRTACCTLSVYHLGVPYSKTTTTSAARPWA